MRYGCRRCGTALPAVQAGETLRVRCSQRACGFVNVIPADPSLAPWEARGSTRLLVMDDPEGAVLLAPLTQRDRSHKFLVAIAALLVFVATLLHPSVRQSIVLRWAVHEIQTTTDAANAQRWCDRLVEIGPAAKSAAPEVWLLHQRRFAGGKMLSEGFINSVIKRIAPDYVDSIEPNLMRESSIQNLIAALQFPDSKVRQRAANLLGERNAQAGPAVTALTNVAGRTQDEGSLAAIDALGQIGPDATGAIQQLIRLLAVSGASRQKAAKALVAIAPGDRRVLQALDAAGIPLTSLPSDNR